jgi:hypothetical protein
VLEGETVSFPTFAATAQDSDWEQRYRRSVRSQ